jgi:hypothetical protein
MLFQFFEQLKTALQQGIQPTPHVLLSPTETLPEDDGSPVIVVEQLPRDWHGSSMSEELDFNQLCRLSLQLDGREDYPSLFDQITAVLIIKQRELSGDLSLYIQSYDDQYTVTERVDTVILKSTSLSDASEDDQNVLSSTLYWEIEVTGTYTVETLTDEEYLIDRVNVRAIKGRFF